MKKIFVLFTFMSLVIFAVNAQNCSHAKTGATGVTQEQENYAKTVAAAAATDESIKQEVCSKSGNVSYSRKVVNEGTDKVSYTAVQYDEATMKFVNISPSDTKKAGCCAGSTKKCCSSSSKSSCGSKSSSTSTSSSTSSSTEDVKVKKVSTQEN